RAGNLGDELRHLDVEAPLERLGNGALQRLQHLVRRREPFARFLLERLQHDRFERAGIILHVSGRGWYRTARRVPERGARMVTAEWMSPGRHRVEEGAHREDVRAP